MAKLVFRRPDEPSIKPQATKMANRKKLGKRALIAIWVIQTILTVAYVYHRS
jgi:hypothetical protein